MLSYSPAIEVALLVLYLFYHSLLAIAGDCGLVPDSFLVVYWYPDSAHVETVCLLTRRDK